jgi:hypothetical protein
MAELNEEFIGKTDTYLITCDKQQVFAHPIWQVYDVNMILTNIYMRPITFYDAIKFPPNCDKKNYLLQKCNIDYKSFFEYAKNSDNEKYKILTNEDAVIQFLVSL